MKNYCKYIFFLLSLIINKLDAQIDPYTFNNTNIVYVNYYFILTSDGTGNFAETHDNDVGSISGFNGYDYAKQVHDHLNYMARNNMKMNMPPENTDVLDIKFHFVLKNIHFVYDDNLFNSLFGLFQTNDRNPKHCTGCTTGTLVQDCFFSNYPDNRYDYNIIITGYGDICNASYGASPKSIFADIPNQSEACYIEYMKDRTAYLYYLKYKHQYDQPRHPIMCDNDIWTIELNGSKDLAKTIYHEYCHRALQDLDYQNSVAECADAPTCSQILEVLPNYSCMVWGLSDEQGNNVMNYNEGYALTPCQLGRLYNSYTDRIEPWGNVRYSKQRILKSSLIARSFYSASYPNISSVGGRISLRDNFVINSNKKYHQFHYRDEVHIYNNVDFGDGKEIEFIVIP